MKAILKAQLLLAGGALSFSLAATARTLHADCELVDPPDHWIAFDKLAPAGVDRFLEEAWDEGVWSYVAIPNDYWLIDLGKRLAYAPGNPDQERIPSVSISDARIHGKSGKGLEFDLDRTTGRLRVTKHQPKPGVVLAGIPIGTTSTWGYQCVVGVHEPFG